MNKKILRKQILNQRQNLSQIEWENSSKLICDRLVTSSLFTQANIIFAYFSFRKEVDLNSLFSFNKKWAFPRCVGKSLEWHLWQPGEVLVKDKYGIKTPLETAPIIPSSLANLILVPAVACDFNGYRLGYGGGFYDRLLSSPQCAEIPTVGIVFDFARISQLPVDSWDIKLDFICTESTLSAHRLI